MTRSGLISRGKMTRKGNIGVLIMLVFIPAILIVAGLVFISIKPVYTDLNQDLMDEFGSEADAIIAHSDANYPSWLDTAFLMVYVGFWIATLLAAWLYTDNPFMLIILIIVFISLAALAAYVSNVWIDYIQTPERESLKGDFPVTDYVLSNGVILVLMQGFIVLFIQILRLGQGGGASGGYQ